MLSTVFTFLCVGAVLVSACNSTCPNSDVTASLAQSLHGIADALTANSKQSCCQPVPLPASCKELKSKFPKATSGYYQIGGKKGPIYVYCNMEELCGSKEGWTRVAYLDMTDSTENCPSGFKLVKSGQVRACGRLDTNAGSCVSTQFQSHGIRYSQVCGKVIGYQFASTDGIYPGRYQDEKYGSVISPHRVDLNSYYVDGVSITHGSPRQHIWTFMAGLNQAGPRSWPGDARYNCPCSTGSPQNVSTIQHQSFIGDDYFCESGNPSSDGTYKHVLYTADALWDGKGCSSYEGDCCKAPGLPWFKKVLKAATTDYLELRVCQDQGTRDEDSPVSSYELYVK